MKIAKFFLVILLFLFVVRPAHAQYEDITVPTDGITPSPTAIPQNTKYDLPYPGILPGSPLYSVKVFRDKILELLISDHEKKANFYVLQADKRLAASLTLFYLGKNSLAENTISKSQNYLEMAINQTALGKKSNENINDVSSKLVGSTQKQIEEIKKQMPEESGEVKQKLAGDLERVETLEKRAEDLHH